MIGKERQDMLQVKWLIITGHGILEAEWNYRTVSLRKRASVSMSDLENGPGE